MSFAFILTAVLLSIVLIVLLTSVFKYNTFLSMLMVSLLLAMTILPLKQVVPAVTTGFGDTMKSIGLIILLGTMIGILLEKTGATISMANAILKLTGKENAGLAIGMTGFTAGIPVFCASGFVVLSGLNKSMVKSTGKPMIYMATMLAAGLYSVHCLIPPHPGALAAAGIMKTNIGDLIMVGILIAIPTTIAGFAWARFMTRNEFKNQPVNITDEKITGDETKLPPAFLSFMPIIIPLLLLTGKSIITLKITATESVFFKIISLAGSPEIALLVGVFLALTLFDRITKKVFNELFDAAIDKSGPILALTGAGGIFGAVIKETGVGDQSGVYLGATGLGLFIPFIISVFLKTAQGSSTVAIMTAASIITPMLTALNLDSESGKLLATLAMGAGSMAISHANDAYFWVVTKFSDLNTDSALKVYSSTTLIMGIAGFLSVWIASRII